MSSNVIYVTNGSCLIDNLVVTDTANGNVFYDFDAELYLPYASGQVVFPPLLKVMGLDCDFDNFAVGSSDSKWTTFRTPENDTPAVVLGDLNGDGEVTLGDSQLMKKILLGSVTEADYVKANADFDGDGEITPRGSRALKALLISQ